MEEVQKKTLGHMLQKNCSSRRMRRDLSAQWCGEKIWSGARILCGVRQSIAIHQCDQCIQSLYDYLIALPDSTGKCDWRQMSSRVTGKPKLWDHWKRRHLVRWVGLAGGWRISYSTYGEQDLAGRAPKLQAVNIVVILCSLAGSLTLLSCSTVAKICHNSLHPYGIWGQLVYHFCAILSLALKREGSSSLARVLPCPSLGGRGWPGTCFRKIQAFFAGTCAKRWGKAKPILTVIGGPAV
jgi:hypothetical protein